MMTAQSNMGNAPSHAEADVGFAIALAGALPAPDPFEVEALLADETRPRCMRNKGGVPGATNP